MTHTRSCSPSQSRSFASTNFSPFWPNKSPPQDRTLECQCPKSQYDRSSGLSAISFSAFFEKPATQANPMSGRFLRTGVFLAPFHSLAENPLLAFDRDMDLLIHLDRLNYHEAWIGEHHSGGFEIIACPEMFIAAAAERTRHIRLGTGVVSLPYHQPLHPGWAADAARLYDARASYVWRRAGFTHL